MDEDTGLLRASVGYAVAGDGARSRLLVGTALHLLAGVLTVGTAALALQVLPVALAVVAVFAVALVAYLPLLGYAAATMRSLLDDEDEPPAVGDPSALFRDGRRLASLIALYALPALVAAVASLSLGPDATTASTALAAAAGVLALAALYLLPAAAVVVVETGETSRAWDPETMRAAVVDGSYLKAWGVGAGVAAVGGAAGAALSVAVAGLGVLFATQTAAVHAATRGVVRSLDITLEDPPAPPASGYVPGWDDGNERKELSDGRLGGSLLPTTPDDEGDEDVGEETPPTPGSPTPTGGDATTALDRRTDGDGGDRTEASSAEAAQEGDIKRFEEDDDTDIATDDDA